MDFSIPSFLPNDAVRRLQEHVRDYKEGDLTSKGYIKKRQELLKEYTSSATSHHRSSSVRSTLSPKSKSHARNHSLASSTQSRVFDVDSSTVSRQGSSIYRVTTCKSNSFTAQSPTTSYTVMGDRALGPSYQPMIPLVPRKDPSPLIESLPSILRGRSQLYEKEIAFVSINRKIKESVVTWDKLYLRAERIAHEISKHKLYKMDKILLWYNKDEIIEYAVALMGCFIAGMIAVPVSFETYTMSDITQIVSLTSSKFVLISESCLRQIDNLHVANSTKIKLTKSDIFSRMTFVKTDELGTYTKAKKNTPTFDIPSVSYIEFTKTPLGRLSGVVMKHKTLSRQLETMASTLNSRSKVQWRKGDIRRSHKGQKSSSRYVILNSLDPTRSTGLILGLLFNIFTGNLMINVDESILQDPIGYENVINRYRVEILLNHQLQLKQVVINYLDNPVLTTSKKKSKIDLSCIKWCLTSCTTIDTEVSDMIVHKWLKNLGCLDASECYSPFLALLDFGGVFISTKDQLGSLDNFPVHSPKLQLQDELFIGKEELKDNIIKPSITAMINSSSSTKDYLRVASFGFPIPDATACIVNPDDQTLAPDLTVGELWISSPSIVDEFYQMDRINDFVFKAKLNYKKMFEIWQTVNSSIHSKIEGSSDRVSMITNICSPQTNFLRTKLMGFVHNGKLYILSNVEDMFLQNKLIRLPNWSHTSDVTRGKKTDEKSIAPTDPEDSISSRRVVQTFYLQHITENIVRMVDKVSELSVFELPNNREEHFLVMVVESSLARAAYSQYSQTSLESTEQTREVRDKKMNTFVEQIYKILWIFHRIQPFCILVVPPKTLPRRYCSLEVANSTVEKKFLSGELPSTFVKFQFDNVILDFIPHSSFYNESIFSEHLSTLRHSAMLESEEGLRSIKDVGCQTSGIDYREKSFDPREGLELTKFDNILEILEWRSDAQANNFAFSDGGSSNSPGSGTSHVHPRISWKGLNAIIAPFIKKIALSKTPLKRGDHVLIISDNSVEKVAIIMACFYCGLTVLPLEPLKDSNSQSEVSFLMNVIQSYKIKRIFVDFEMNAILEESTNISRNLKKFKHMLPKITVYSKIKKKSGQSPKDYKETLREKFGIKTSSLPKTEPCVIWIDRESDNYRDINVALRHKDLLNMCKIYKETLQLTSDNPIVSLCSHTIGMGFLQFCLMGIYIGATTFVFKQSEVTRDPKDFMIALQNLSVKDVILDPDMLYLVMDKGNSIISARSQSANEKSGSKLTKTTLRPDFLRNVQNIMVPFKGRPKFYAITNLLARYSSIVIDPMQINYVYHHSFNPLISLRSYLGIPPMDIYLDPTSLKEGIVKDVNPYAISPSELERCIHLQDCGIVPVCADVSIVNPETLEPCFENEFGEIWCCSEANAYDYYISKADAPFREVGSGGHKKGGKGGLAKDSFLSAQFKARAKGEKDNGLSYLRTGDLGFIKSVSTTDSRGNVLNLSLLYVLGSISETVEILGLTHFVADLEMTVKASHFSISSCIVAKAGGLLCCLLECRGKRVPEYSNLVPLIVAALLQKNGVVIDLCCFVRPNSLTYASKDWSKLRVTLLSDWLNQKLRIDEQVGVNFGENNSIYLLSDFERTSQ
ncbi:LAMI_0F09538g1_1 [Lachancea mirantina]|uniref:LAMI_0F09538g1_1 n=1 Tax=Lachancea mirantina TaxID=1230905 RepID=A0A1G4K181_9SACH|nr:LAMI_0F09538g1_1 [Lachancea mirantina]